MARRSGEHVSDQAQPSKSLWEVRYDEDGRVLHEPAAVKPTPRLPGSIVEYWGDDPGDWSGLRDELDTPEARMQNPEVQARLLRQYQATAATRALDFDFDEAECYWFGDTHPGSTPYDNPHPHRRDQ